MTSAARKKLLQACFSFLLPVARFLLAAGISYREFSDVSRVAFVRVASREFGLRGRPTNISRISAMTGVPRKDVSKLRHAPTEYENDLRIELSPVGDVLHYWHTAPEYLDPRGRPMRLSASDGPLSFVELVRRSVGDVPSGAIKAELVRFGAVIVEPDGAVCASRRYVVPEGAHEKLISAMSFSLRNLAETIAYNSSTSRTGAERVERIVQSGHLESLAIEKLRKILREKMAGFTEEIDDLFFNYEPHRHSGSGKRIGIGTYYFEDTD